MKKIDAFRRILFDEVDQEESCGYAFWQSIPSSSTLRALALLRIPQPGRSENRLLHRAAVEDILTVNLANERREPACVGSSLPTWLERSRQPWRFGISSSEWDLKGYRERQLLAGELLNMRRNIHRLTTTAKTVASYYEGVSDEQLELALSWKPIVGRQFFDRLLNATCEIHIDRVRRLPGDRQFRFAGFGCELELEAAVKGGVLSYGIFGFFDHPAASSSYEALFGIGIGEWDFLDGRSLDSSVSVFLRILEKHLRWKRERE